MNTNTQGDTTFIEGLAGDWLIPQYTNLTLSDIVKELRAPLFIRGIYSRCEVHGREGKNPHYRHHISPVAVGCLALLEYVSIVPKPAEGTTSFMESQLQRKDIEELIEIGLMQHTS